MIDYILCDQATLICTSMLKRTLSNFLSAVFYCKSNQIICPTASEILRKNNSLNKNPKFFLLYEGLTKTNLAQLLTN